MSARRATEAIPVEDPYARLRDISQAESTALAIPGVGASVSFFILLRNRDHKPNYA